MKLSDYFAVALGAVVANFAYQVWPGAGDWMVASERSFFQFWAIALVYGMDRLHAKGIL